MMCSVMYVLIQWQLSMSRAVPTSPATLMDWTALDHLHCWRSMTWNSSHRGIVSGFRSHFWPQYSETVVPSLPLTRAVRFLRQAGCHVMLLPIHETKTYSGLGSLDMAHVIGQWELFIGMWLSGTSHPRPYVIHRCWSGTAYSSGRTPEPAYFAASHHLRPGV